MYNIEHMSHTMHPKTHHPQSTFNYQYTFSGMIQNEDKKRPHLDTFSGGALVRMYIKVTKGLGYW